MEIYVPKYQYIVGADFNKKSVKKTEHPANDPMNFYDKDRQMFGIVLPSEKLIGRWTQTIRESPFSTVFLIEGGEQKYVGKILKKTPGYEQIHNQTLVQSDLFRRLGYHPNIETYLGIGVLNNPLQPVLVTEYVNNNQSIYDYMNTTFKPNDILPIIQQLLAAVSHAHKQRIVHGDISLDNILIQPQNSEPHLKLIDFSIGAYIPPYIDRIQSRIPIGTKYATPIEHTRTRLYGFADDIYGIGYVLYQLLHKPYFESSEDQSEELSTIEAFTLNSFEFELNDKYKHIFIESEIIKVLKSALHQQYHLRIQSISDLADQLNKCLL